MKFVIYFLVILVSFSSCDFLMEDEKPIDEPRIEFKKKLESPCFTEKKNKKNF